MKVLLVTLFLFGLSFGHDYNEKPPAKLSCNCGWRNRKRIVGGTETGVNEYPWMAAVMRKLDKNQFWIECGGSIITAWHVISGAHCISGITAEELVVCVGTNDLTMCGPDKKTIEVKEIYNNDFDPKTLFNDISLLLTRTIMEFTKFVGPACFPKNAITSELDNESLKLMGWGFSEDIDGEIMTLSELEVKVIPWETCHTTYQGLDKKKTQICSHSPTGISCGADGGDPLVWYDQDVESYTVVALVSFDSKGCQIRKEPSINTNVTSFSSWILQKVAAKEGAVVCSKN